MLVGLHACALAAALRPIITTWPALGTHARIGPVVFLEQQPGASSTLVEQQAAEIAELRRMVEALQRDVEDQQVALGGGATDEGLVPLQSKPAAKLPVYKLYDNKYKLPKGFDAAPIERLIARRVRARLKKHYSEADRLQKRILRMGVILDDRRRTWSLRPRWQEMQERVVREDDQNGRQKQMLQQELEERIKFLFQYWDEDGNGLIDRAEFRLAMQVLAIPGTAEDYDKTFDTWDADGNGGLNFKEIRQALLDLQKALPQVVESAHLTVSILSE